MRKIDDLRIQLIADFTSKAVRMADKIEKKVKYLEQNELFRIKGQYTTLCDNGVALEEILKINIPDDVSKWLRTKDDKITWQTWQYLKTRLDSIYSTDIPLEEDWDFATMTDGELYFLSLSIAVDVDHENWTNLDEETRRELRIIFDAVDNSKYFMHSIQGYFLNDENVEVDTDYKNHLLARL